jgi:hypothetical protein
MVFTCDGFPQAEVRMSVWDKKFNTDYCDVFLSFSGTEDCIDEPVVEDACDCTPDAWTGWTVVTCNAEPGSGDPVGAIYNTRAFDTAPSSADWTPSTDVIMPTNWTVDQIGQIFGIALDEQNNIYLAASDVYDTQYEADPFGPGQIFRATPGDFIAEPFVELPNTGGSLNGIGNIVYCRASNMLYASNLEDGQIYRINDNGQVMETYDPWTVDDGTPGIVSPAEQVWGIGLNVEGDVKKLYFPRIGGGERSMYSITLGSGGSFPTAGSEVLEFSSIPGVGNRITDIAFNADTERMVFSERGTFFTTGAHDSRVQGYTRASGSWEFDLKYFAGSLVTDVFPNIVVESGENAAGGVTYAHKDVTTDVEGCDDVVWFSTHWIRNEVGELFYGIQGADSDGNNPYDAAVDPNLATDAIIDFDGNYTNFDQKGSLGDVETFHCAEPTITPTSNRVAVAGLVNLCDDLPLAGVEFTLDDMGTAEQKFTVSAQNGQYAFIDLEPSMTAMISGTVAGDADEGVSTLDIVLIQRHILDISPISDCELIAADVNMSGTVTGADIVELRRLILGITDEFMSGDAWRLVDDNSISTMQSLSDVKDEVMLTDMEQDNMDVNWRAIKLGDVNMSVAEGRSATSIDFIYDDVNVTTGEIIELDLTASSYADVYGYQMTLDLDGLELVEVVGGDLNVTNANVAKIDDRTVTMSYASASVETASDVMTLILKAKRDGKISNMLHSSSRVTRAEAYVADGSDIDVASVTLTPRGGADYALYQNEPNPFKAFTTVSWTMAEAGTATITVYDVAGRVIKRVTNDAVAGLNSLNFTRNEFNATGVLYYQLEAGNYTATKKMILID